MNGKMFQDSLCYIGFDNREAKKKYLSRLLFIHVDAHYLVLRLIRYEILLHSGYAFETMTVM